MKARALFSMVLFLAVTLVFSVQFSYASGIGCDVWVFPENPTEADEVQVFVNFDSRTWPPFVENFGETYREGNVFSVVVTVHVPAKGEVVRPSAHSDQFMYNLGRLEAGEYIFKVYVQTVHGSSEYWLEKEVKFTVSSSDDEAIHAVELPNISYVLVLLALTSVATILLKASKRRH